MMIKEKNYYKYADHNLSVGDKITIAEQVLHQEFHPL